MAQERAHVHPSGCSLKGIVREMTNADGFFRLRVTFAARTPVQSNIKLNLFHNKKHKINHY